MPVYCARRSTSHARKYRDALHRQMGKKAKEIFTTVTSHHPSISGLPHDLPPSVRHVGVNRDFFLERGKFSLRKSSFTEANFREIFAKSGKPAPPAARPICRLAPLACLLIRNGAGRGERGRISGRFAELTLRGCRLSPNRRSLLFGLACSVLCVALSLLSPQQPLYPHYICSLAALRQANFRRFSRAARAGKF